MTFHTVPSSEVQNSTIRDVGRYTQNVTFHIKNQKYAKRTEKWINVLLQLLAVVWSDNKVNESCSKKYSVVQYKNSYVSS